MPLRDHFRPPLSELASWEGLHGGWPMVIVQQLGPLLPAEYRAEPRVHLGAQIEIDVATFDRDESRIRRAVPDHSITPQLAWSPAEPTLAVETDMADFDQYEARVFDVRHGRRLVAAVEIVSPANKDRAESRHQFTAKCAALLRQGVSLVLVDLVTVRNTNLYAELLSLTATHDPALTDRPPPTYATACRWRPSHGSSRLETWYHPFATGEQLPCLPLWLAADLAIPLDLEASYEQTCRDLRIA